MRQVGGQQAGELVLAVPRSTPPANCPAPVATLPPWGSLHYLIGGRAVSFKGFRYDRKEATVKPVDATRGGCSSGLRKLAGTLLIPGLVLFPLGGCSLAFVDGPSRAPSPSGNACTRSYTAPTLDLLGVPATFVLGFGFGGFERSLEAVAPDDDDTFGNLEKASLAASGVLLVSSVYGFVQVGRCRGARQRGGGPQLVPSRRDDRFFPHRLKPPHAGR